MLYGRGAQCDVLERRLADARGRAVGPWWSARPTGPAGMAVMAYGLVVVQTAKAWFIDRMVLLYEHMKAGNPAYAAWEY